LMVSQFKDNKYSTLEYNAARETFYSIQKKISEADIITVYRLPELSKVLQKVRSENIIPGQPNSGIVNDLRIIKNETSRIAGFNGFQPFRHISSLESEKFTPGTADSLSAYIAEATRFFSEISNSAQHLRDQFFNLNEEKLRGLEKRYFNYKLEEIVTRYYEPDKILRYKDSFIQNTHPVYQDPEKNEFLRFRTHFFAPSKNIFKISVDTFVFNISIIFFGIIILYIILYYDLLAGLLNFFKNFKSRKVQILKTGKQ